MEKWKKFFYLTTLWESEQRPIWKSWKLIWYEKCICICWKITWVNRSMLKWPDKKSRWVKSCWCHRRNTALVNISLAQEKNTTHWMSYTPFYNIYQWILRRCYNKNDTSYKNYWWRGIECVWNSFEEFKDDMYNSYLEHIMFYWKNTSLDRIDVNWNYCKENCRWATQQEQSLNTRWNVRYNWRWEDLTLTEILNKEWLSIDRRIVWWRLKHWRDLEDAVFTDSTLYHKWIKIWIDRTRSSVKSGYEGK